MESQNRVDSNQPVWSPRARLDSSRSPGRTSTTQGDRTAVHQGGEPLFRERVFGGAVQPMLAHFVQETKLSEEDIAQLRRILDEKEAEVRPGKRRPGKAES